MLDRLFAGRRPELTGVAPAGGEALGVRLFGLLPVLRRTDSSVLPDVFDALARFHEVDPDHEQIEFALAYCHLCEVMPEVWRELYDAEMSGEGVIVLRHPDDATAALEVRDTLLMQIGAPTLVWNPITATTTCAASPARYRTWPRTTMSCS